jgi:hypothetical protein
MVEETTTITTMASVPAAHKTSIYEKQQLKSLTFFFLKGVLFFTLI